MLAARGVALGLGGMNLTELSKGLNAGSSATANYYRQQQVRRCSSLAGAAKNSPYRLTPARPSPQSRLAESDRACMEQKANKKEGPIRDRHEKQPQPEDTKRIVVKRAFNRRTFWAACRAIIFGALLVLMGAAMCTIGYYNDYFAMEPVVIADNVTALIPNPSKKFQYQSLTYIGTENRFFKVAFFKVAKNLQNIF